MNTKIAISKLYDTKDHILWTAKNNDRISVYTNGKVWTAEILAGIDFGNIVRVSHSPVNGAFRFNLDLLTDMEPGEFTCVLSPKLDDAYNKMKWPKDPTSDKALANLMKLCNVCNKVYHECMK